MLRFRILKQNLNWIFFPILFGLCPMYTFILILDLPACLLFNHDYHFNEEIFRITHYSQKKLLLWELDWYWTKINIHVLFVNLHISRQWWLWAKCLLRFYINMTYYLYPLWVEEWVVGRLDLVSMLLWYPEKNIKRKI